MATRAKEFPQCVFRQTPDGLEGKRKFAIIDRLLQHRVLRFRELERDVAGSTARMLVKELKLPEAHGMVRCQPYATVPPTVEYSLTTCGWSLQPVIEATWSWGEQNKAALQAA